MAVTSINFSLAWSYQTKSGPFAKTTGAAFTASQPTRHNSRQHGPTTTQRSH